MFPAPISAPGPPEAASIYEKMTITRKSKEEEEEDSEWTFLCSMTDEVAPRLVQESEEIPKKYTTLADPLPTTWCNMEGTR